MCVCLFLSDLVGNVSDLFPVLCKQKRWSSEKEWKKLSFPPPLPPPIPLSCVPLPRPTAKGSSVVPVSNIFPRGRFCSGWGGCRPAGHESNCQASIHFMVPDGARRWRRGRRRRKEKEEQGKEEEDERKKKVDRRYIPSSLLKKKKKVFKFFPYRSVSV